MSDWIFLTMVGAIVGCAIGIIVGICLVEMDRSIDE